jgi:hypothetical protein
MIIGAGGVAGAHFVKDTWGCSIHIPEITTPTAVADYGSLYPKSDNRLYFQDGAGTEQIVLSTSGADTKIGAGAAGVDYTLTFDGETSDGILTWLEDESVFSFDSDLTTAGDFTQKVNTTDVSNPPTDAELDAAFGTPATVGTGWSTYIDDAAGGANFYHIVSDGTNWWHFAGTKAV